LVEVEQAFSSETVVPNGRYATLDPRFIPRRTDSGRVDEKATDLRVLEKGTVELGTEGSALSTIALVLSTIRTRKIPEKNSQAASQASMARSVVSWKAG